MENYEQIKVIGSGGFGSAILARSRITNEKCVIKSIKISPMFDVKNAIKEANILMSLDHPNIIKYIDRFQDNDFFYLVMEYAEGGDLSKKIEHYIKSKQQIPEKEIIHDITQVLKALEYVHRKKVIHRDLKPQNILVTKYGTIKLGDFGISRQLDYTAELATTQCGTYYYMSPEILQGLPYDSKTDIWSLGCVLYELCALKRPFEGILLPSLIFKILGGKFSPIPSIYSNDMQNLISSMLTVDPKHRFTIEQILSLPFLQQKSKITIGIDLGTTYSCVGVFLDDTVEILTNSVGQRTTPSYVTFTNDQILVGNPAKDAEWKNVGNAVFDVKRLIGRNFDDPVVQSDMKNWPFKVVCGESNRPMIEITYKRERKRFYPEQISALVLAEMKRIAEENLGVEVTDAVITVPAYFNDSQRSSTKAAGEIAGLNVLSIINEPTAAAIAYGMKRKLEDERIILVYDLGGGTFDVSLVKVQDKKFEAIATAGDTHLGGRDFDNRLFKYFADRFQNKYGCDLRSNPTSSCRLRNECEAVKKILSVNPLAEISCMSLFNGIDFIDQITQPTFEELNEDLFDKTINIVSEVINEAKISKSKITDIVLVGGSSHIPRIKELLKDFFEGKKNPCRYVNPDEAVAFGAAIRAANFAGDEALVDMNLHDITPLSLGTNVIGGLTSIIIPKNTRIPCNLTCNYITTTDDQENMVFQILEGERKNIEDNNLLGVIKLTNIKKAPRGKNGASLTYSIDENGILSVKAQEFSSNNTKEKAIVNETGRLKREDILKMKALAQIFLEDDLKFELKVKAMNSFQDYCYKCKRKIQKQENVPNWVKTEIQDAIKWTNNNQGAEIEIVEKKRTEFEAKIKDFLNK